MGKNVDAGTVVSTWQVIFNGNYLPKYQSFNGNTVGTYVGLFSAAVPRVGTDCDKLDLQSIYLVFVVVVVVIVTIQ
jgi:hypothetical protein